MTREAVQAATTSTPRGSSPVFSTVPGNHPVIRRAEDFPPGSWSDVTATAIGAARAVLTKDLSASAGEERRRALGDLAAAARIGGCGPALAAVGTVALISALQEKKPAELNAAVSAVLPDENRATMLPYALLHARTLSNLFSNDVCCWYIFFEKRKKKNLLLILFSSHI